ncbi:hypothetical protein SAMN02746089_02163 [Caldanaerobius fijiensis DSM 17918]|uniref:Uncharacterized protein n=1 Tax=Caldanaerobius fijiensis DSM 17918 TaxID=1121256 RepID=A0A1M5CNC1_9THEO|nr:hypothetical protein SAMN02746089_02163 [Caldanaerobius fijiensis DSM 17918]
MTNYYSKVKDFKSEVYFQFWNRPGYEVSTINGNGIGVFFYNSQLNFSDEIRGVYDGLISYIKIAQVGNGVLAEIFTELETRYEVAIGDSVPFSLVVSLDRTPLMRFFNGKTVRLIPSSEMYLSPTKLVEKVVMEKISGKIGNLIKQYGCRVINRDDDTKADVSIYLGLLHEAKNFSGYCIMYDSYDCERAALDIYKGLKQKLPLDDHGCIYNEKINEVLKGVVSVIQGI